MRRRVFAPAACKSCVLAECAALPQGLSVHCGFGSADYTRFIRLPVNSQRFCLRLQNIYCIMLWNIGKVGVIMLDSSTSLMLLILLGVVILVILSVAFLTHMKKADKDNDIRLDHIDKSIQEIKQCIASPKKSDAGERKSENSPPAVKVEAVGAVQAPGSSARADAQGKPEAESPSWMDAKKRAVSPWQNAPHKQDMAPEPRVSVNRQPEAGVSVNRQPEPQREEPIIREIKPREIHSLDRVLKDLDRGAAAQTLYTAEAERKGSALRSRASTQEAKNDAQVPKPMNTVKRGQEQSSGQGSLAEALKKGALKMKDVGIEKVSVPIEEDRSQKVKTAGEKKTTPIHFVDRSTATDRQGRIYSVDQLKEQIK